MNLPPITYQEMMAWFAESRAQFAEIREQSAETREQFAEMRKKSAETDKQIAETSKEIAALREQSAQTDKQIAQTGKEIAELGVYIKTLTEKTDKELKQMAQKTDKELKQLAKQVADVTDTLGRFAEAQVRPKILELFSEKGIELKEIYPRVIIKENGQHLVEMDLLLVNTIYSVVVEVKNTLRTEDINKHIKRMEKLQGIGHRLIKGTKIFGAVAGMIVGKEVEEYAIKKGFYVIKPKGDDMEVANKTNFVAQVWEVTSN